MKLFKHCAWLLLLCALPAFATDAFVQAVCSTNQDTVITVSITGVVAGNTLVAFAYNGDSATTAPTVGDGQSATWTARGSTISDSTNLVSGRAYELDAANSGTHSVTTNNMGAGNPGFMCVVEVTTTAATPFSGANGQAQVSPGGGAGAVSTGTVTVTGASTLISLASDTSSANNVTAVSGTSRATGTDNAIGGWRVQTQAASSNAAGTFTAGSGAERFMSIGVAILNASGGGSTAAAGIFVTLP